jgi:hypothetical protein
MAERLLNRKIRAAKERSSELGRVYFFLHSFKLAKQGHAASSFFFNGGFVISFNLSLPQPASEELGTTKKHAMAKKATILRMAWFLEELDAENWILQS